MATIIGTENADTLTGTGSDDVISGLGGRDDLEGWGGKDTIYGGAGDDLLNGGSTYEGPGEVRTFFDDGLRDEIYGGTGKDHVLIGVNDVADGGDGTDSVTFFFENQTKNISFVFSESAFTIAAVNVSLSHFEDFIYWGGSGRDTITGGAGNDEIMGGAGNDVLNGGAGNDKIYGDSGNNTIHGDDGNDFLVGAVETTNSLAVPEMTL